MQLDNTKNDASLPLVTIVTPVYNQANYLAETIESVLAQSYQNIEYIVIDDGSSDDSLSVARQYEDRGVKVLTQVNSGQAATLNKGWGLANGEYLAYLSSDDVIYADAIECLVSILKANPGVVCAFPDSDLIDIRSRVIKGSVCKPFDLESLIVRQECYIGPGAVFRRSGFETVGGWRPELKLAPDREFWIRLASCGVIQFCPIILAGYRMHPRSISYKDVSEEVSQEYVWVLDQYFDAPGACPAESIITRRSEAYGYAKLIIARNCMRSGRLMRGMALYKEACGLHAPLDGLKIKLTLMRNIVSKPIRATLARLNLFLGS